MHVNHDIEPSMAQRPRESEVVEHPRHAARTPDDDELVEVGISPDDSSRFPFDEIGEMRLRKPAPQRARQTHPSASLEARGDLDIESCPGGGPG